MQALIITAYHNEALLERNLKKFSSFFKCYVHIDQKSELNCQQTIDKLNSIKNVTVISKYKINWGSCQHMFAILDLMKLALLEPDITRIHIISGDDFPIKSFAEFERFFEKENRYANFIECTDITDMPVMKLRYEKFHFLHILDRKSKNKCVILLDKIIRHVQYMLPFKRKHSFDYKGLVWSSLSIEGVKEIMAYMTKDMIRILKYCEIPEEFMVQNALMLSPIKDTVVIDKKRYDDWTNSLTGPKVLTIKDYDAIKASDAFFARKITDYPSCSDAAELYNKLFGEL